MYLFIIISAQKGLVYHLQLIDLHQYTLFYWKALRKDADAAATCHLSFVLAALNAAIGVEIFLKRRAFAECPLKGDVRSLCVIASIYIRYVAIAI